MVHDSVPELGAQTRLSHLKMPEVQDLLKNGNRYRSQENTRYLVKVAAMYLYSCEYTKNSTMF